MHLVPRKKAELLLVVLIFGVLASSVAYAQEAAPRQAVVLPDGQELQDEELQEVKGKVWQGMVVGALTSVATRVTRNYRTGKLWHHNVGRAAVRGAVSGLIAGGRVFRYVGFFRPRRIVDFAGIARSVAGGVFSGICDN